MIPRHTFVFVKVALLRKSYDKISVAIARHYCILDRLVYHNVTAQSASPRLRPRWGLGASV